jgi:hypothetical protein
MHPLVRRPTIAALPQPIIRTTPPPGPQIGAGRTM